MKQILFAIFLLLLSWCWLDVFGLENIVAVFMLLVMLIAMGIALVGFLKKENTENKEE